MQLTPDFIRKYIPKYLRKSKNLMILVTDIEGIILYVNDFYLKHFNFKSENVVGKLYTTQIFLGDNERILEAIKKCIENPQNSEKIIIRKPKKHNKTYYYSSWEFFAIVNDLKEPIGILSIGYDISDSFILDDPEIDEFYSLVNNMTAESWTFYDTDLHLRTCNQKAIEIAKNVFNVEPIKGDHAMMYVLEEHKPIMYKAYQKALTGEQVQMELSNSTGHFVITLKPIYDKSGKLLGIAHYCLDITSLKKSQEENRILSTRFQTLINQINGIVLIVDLKGKIQYVSDNIKKLSGFDKEFVINRQFSDFIYPDDLPELNQAFENLRNLNDTVVIAFRSLNADGSYNYTLGRGIVIEEDGEKYILSVILNIDELRQKDEIIEKHHKRFQQIAWLQSHEVRAPLARLLGLTDAIYTDLIEDREELKQFIHHIKQSALDLDAVIHKIVQLTDTDKKVDK